MAIYSREPSGLYRIDFGCGDRRHPRCNIGVDQRPCKGLTHLHSDPPPLPFPDNSCDLIFTNHVMEHFSKTLFQGWMDEFGRLLCPGGILEVGVPHWSCGSVAWASLDHARPFGCGSLLSYDPRHWENGIYPQLGDGKWRVLEVRLSYRSEHKVSYPNKLVAHAYDVTNGILNFLANLNTGFCERIWATWVGGFTDVKTIMERL